MHPIQKHKLPHLLDLIIFSLVGIAAWLTLSHGVLAATNPSCNKANPTKDSLGKCLETNPIVDDLNKIVTFLSAGVGIVVTGVIIVGGIQYMTAGDNPQAITAAKKRITNGLIALMAFLFMFAFIQWLIPGGIFKK